MKINEKIQSAVNMILFLKASLAVLSKLYNSPSESITYRKYQLIKHAVMVQTISNSSSLRINKIW